MNDNVYVVFISFHSRLVNTFVSYEFHDIHCYKFSLSFYFTTVRSHYFVVGFEQCIVMFFSFKKYYKIKTNIEIEKELIEILFLYKVLKVYLFNKYFLYVSQHVSKYMRVKKETFLSSMPTHKTHKSRFYFQNCYFLITHL